MRDPNGLMPASLGLDEVDRLPAAPDGAVAAGLDEALDEWERVPRKPGERIDREPRRDLSSFALFVGTLVERRRSRWAASG